MASKTSTTVGRLVAVMLCWGVFCAAAIPASQAVQAREGSAATEPDTRPLPSIAAVEASLGSPFAGAAPGSSTRTGLLAALDSELAESLTAPAEDGPHLFGAAALRPLPFGAVKGQPWRAALGPPGQRRAGGAALTASEDEIPAMVLAAYRQAARQVSLVQPDCRVPWYLLAGIGRVESGHALHHGASTIIGADGRVAPPIIGLPLNGAPGLASIPDSDNGTWDGDRRWDRAVGPMQFIPSSWRLYGQDGSGDGVADPHNVFDAALAAAAHLCGSSGGDLRKSQRMARAVYGYNRSTEYVAAVMDLAVGYARAGNGRAVAVVPSVTNDPSFSSPGDRFNWWEVGAPPAVDVPASVTWLPPGADDTRFARDELNRTRLRGNEPAGRRLGRVKPRQERRDERARPDRDRDRQKKKRKKPDSERVAIGPREPSKRLPDNRSPSPKPKPSPGESTAPPGDGVPPSDGDGADGEEAVPSQPPANPSEPDSSEEPAPSEPAAPAEPTPTSRPEQEEPSAPDPTPVTGVLHADGSVEGTLPSDCGELGTLVQDRLDADGTGLVWSSIVATVVREPAAELEINATDGDDEFLWGTAALDCSSGQAAFFPAG